MNKINNHINDLTKILNLEIERNFNSKDFVIKNHKLRKSKKLCLK